MLLNITSMKSTCILVIIDVWGKDEGLNIEHLEGSYC